MTLSKRGDYVVRSALSLARAHPSGEWRKIREVTAEMGVPRSFASQILSDLVVAGLASSRAGSGGGYRLVRPPAEITLLEVIEAGEGPLRSERCALGDGPCRWESVCPLHETWGAATAVLRDALSKTSLEALALRDEAIERSTYPLPVDSHRPSSTVLTAEDWVQVELPAEVVERRLARCGPWLAGCVRSAYHDADRLRAGIDPSGLPWDLSAQPVVAIEPVGPRPQEAPGMSEAPDEPPGLRLAWEAGGSRGPASRFEGTVRARAIDPDRTELSVKGLFRPPAALAAADLALARRLTQATLRSALREVARALEHS